MIFPKNYSLLLLCSLMFACSSTPPLGDPEMPYPPPHEPAVGDILHIPTGIFVTQEQMLAAVTDAKIVYVGETHDNPASHRLEAMLLKALAERYPEQVALGMEMMTPEQQPVLDRWVAGELSEKELLEQSRWYDIWRMDFDYYKELFQLCRDKKIPIIGLNATKAQVKAVASNDFSKLDEEQRKQIPTLDMADPYQRAMVKTVFGGHNHGGGDKERFLRVQTLWDEMMAANVARYLTTPQGSGRHMLVIAGGHHVSYGFGIPRRVFRRLPVSYVLVGNEDIEYSGGKKEKVMDVTLPNMPMPALDYVLYTKYEKLDKQQVRLGVLLDESDNGVEIKAILPSSAAARAGLQKGDILRAIDGETVTKSFDVIYVIKQKQPGDEVNLLIEREGKNEQLKVHFDKKNSK
ncbi:MAG TPA: PDZ domain-containing protein [Gammaproteobacteria bacterium]|nr:PDZ domain-containing protein [Gammaproteobacteria bacterium]